MRELDPSVGPLHFFGAELRRARTAAGLSQEQLGQRIGYSGDLVGKVETGERAPSLDFSQRCDQALPDTDGLLLRIHQVARRWLLQTPDYARALFRAWQMGSSDDADIENLISACLERQAIFDRPHPPVFWAVIDEAVLYRLIGSPKIMHDQLLYVAEAAGRPGTTVQVVPSGIGAHAGLLGGFAIASIDGTPQAVYMESPDRGQTTESPAVIRELSLTFGTLRADALPSTASRDLIGKVAEERWASA